MSIKELFTLINSTRGTYLDYNSKDLNFTSNLLASSSNYREYKFAGRFKDKKFYRRASDLVNLIINSKLGDGNLTDNKPLTEVVNKNTNVVKLGHNFSVEELKYCLNTLEDSSLIIFDKSNYSEEIKEFKTSNNLVIEFVSDANFYYIIKGKVVKKTVMRAQPAKKVVTRTIVNTLASTVDRKIGRDVSPNLT